MSATRTVAVVTGARSEFGLLRPVMDAIEARPDLDLLVFVTGTHLLPPVRTVDEVAAAFPIAATIEMQRDGAGGRHGDAAALGRGVSGFAEAIDRHRPDVVLVLGDRIEALAAASAAAVAGVRVAHMHGGDRAEGFADEGIRHAITKLAHIHLPASEGSAERIVAMGEARTRVHLVGSPALDGLSGMGPLDDALAPLGHPEIVFLLHPTDDRDAVERDRATRLLALCCERGRVLALYLTPDPGSAGIREAIASAAGVVDRPHLPRPTFVGALRRSSMIVGNSSAGLIECAALPLRCVNVGSRQAGRERGAHVVDCPEWDFSDIARALDRAASEPMPDFAPPYGDGRSGERTAAVLATFEADNHRLTKHNTY